MFFSTFTLLALAQSVSVAFAQTSGFATLTSPTEQSVFQIGETLPIVWQPGSSTGSISIDLIGGATTSSLDIITTVASSLDVTTGEYDWTIPSDVGALATYGLNVTSNTDSSLFQYSYAFHIKGGTSASGSGASSSSVLNAAVSSTSAAASSSFASSSSVSSVSAAESTSSIASETSSAKSTVTMLSTSTAASVTVTTTPSMTSSFVPPPSSSGKSNSQTSSGTSTATPAASTGGAGMTVVSGGLAAGCAMVFAFAL